MLSAEEILRVRKTSSTSNEVELEDMDGDQIQETLGSVAAAYGFLLDPVDVDTVEIEADDPDLGW